VRRAEFFRKAGERASGEEKLAAVDALVNLASKKKQLLNELFKLNRRIMKLSVKEALQISGLQVRGRCGALLERWVDQLAGNACRLSETGQHACGSSDGILNYCRTKVRLAWWKASTPISVC